MSYNYLRLKEFLMYRFNNFFVTIIRRSDPFIYLIISCKSSAAVAVTIEINMQVEFTT